MMKGLSSIALAVTLAFFGQITPSKAQNPSEISKIAEDAYVFAYPMLFGYQTLYTQTQDATFSG
jgi:hypothetical protein